MSGLVAFLNTGLGRLLVGVILGAGIFLYRKSQQQPLLNVVKELLALLFLAVPLGITSLLMGETYLTALTTTLTALLVPLGLNSRGVGAPPPPPVKETKVIVVEPVLPPPPPEVG